MPDKADRRFPLLVLTLLAVALAGCADVPAGQTLPPPVPDEPEEEPPGEPAPADLLSVEGGQRLYEEAIFDFPPRVGLAMIATQEGKPLLSLRGHKDEQAGTAWFRMEADPAFLGHMPEEMPAGVAQGFQDGVEVYVSPGGSLYLAGGMAIVYPPGAASGLLPLPEESPFMDLFESFRPQADRQEERNVTVDRVAPVVHKGRSALQLEMHETTENGTSTGRVILYANPPRIAHVAMRMMDGEESFRGADVTVDFLYGDEVPSQPSTPISRALALAYESRTGFAGSAQDPAGRAPETTWTFVAEAGIPLDEVEVVVKEQSMDVERLDQMETRWTMRLDEGARSVEGVAVSFTDADGDGLVSRGDTLRFTVPEGEDVFVVLRDVKTGAYVVPGPAPLLALGMAGLAALLLRRR